MPKEVDSDSLAYVQPREHLQKSVETLQGSLMRYLEMQVTGVIDQQ